MDALFARLNAYAPVALAALRIMSGLLFIQHGTQKFFGVPPSGKPAPDLLSLFGLGGVIEIVGGLLIVLGLFTRPAAFLCSGQMAVAYFLFHAAKSPFPAANGGDAAVLFCFVFLYLVFSGPGALSLDHARGRRAL